MSEKVRPASYSLGAYNKFDDKEQYIRITEGCPNNCPYCYEPTEIKVFGIPEIVRNDVKIMDMNLLCKPEALAILQELKDKLVDGKVVYYSLICGIDWRFLTPELAQALHDARIAKIRLAWDYGFHHQFKVMKAVKALKKAGYANNKIMIFMVCNWKTPYEENLRKLEVAKVWGVQVSDCWFDNQLPPNINPIHWTAEQIKDFRKRCRKHNHLVTYGYDPETPDRDIDNTDRLF
jgi:predicted transglutaminase-like protease